MYIFVFAQLCKSTLFWDDFVLVDFFGRLRFGRTCFNRLDFNRVLFDRLLKNCPRLETIHLNGSLIDDDCLHSLAKFASSIKTFCQVFALACFKRVKIKDPE